MHFSGAVYTWGHNADGQLGLGDYDGRAVPTLVEDAVMDQHHAMKVALQTL